mmetsp:Transcript_10634/g.22094  ORF Transcript_10634/g.22094 Transcript_10634/m.22094 type:complete len:119 (-) Transcript_10634:16-372(-)
MYLLKVLWKENFQHQFVPSDDFASHSIPSGPFSNLLRTNASLCGNCILATESATVVIIVSDSTTLRQQYSERRTLMAANQALPRKLHLLPSFERDFCGSPPQPERTSQLGEKLSRLQY